MVRWQLASSLDKEYIFELAESKGWYDNPPKVQVKREVGVLGEIWFILEPYEENCTCSNLIYPKERIK